jgi:5'-deoxynucleotidase YfbR-like HD superfamily hydrolase
MNSMSRLASLTRFSMERLSCRESVLEHLGQVALTSYALAVEVRARDPEADVSVRECVARALVHDLEELITGDVARPTKHSSSEAKKLFDDLSKKSVEILRREMSYFPSFAADMERCHWAAKTGVDGLIVAVADVLAVATKVWEEVILRGSGAMIRQAYSAERQLVALQSRIAKEDLAAAAKTFLLRLLDEAVLLMWKAQRQDSDLFGTKVEAY